MKNTVDKPEFISNYFFTHKGDDDIFLTLHALFNCMSEEEITRMYFDHCMANSDLKKTLENYITRRTVSEPRRYFDKVARRLMAAYQGEAYGAQLKIRVFLTGLIRSLPVQTIRIYFDLFIQSERIVDRRRAGGVADLILSDEVEGKLWDNFHRYKDEESLIPLVTCLSPDDLCRLMEKCWTLEFPSYKLKNVILSKITKSLPRRLAFLKEREPAYFLRAMAFKQIKVDAKILGQLGKTMTEEQKKFTVWYLGLTGDWRLVTKYIKTQQVNLNANRIKSHTTDSFFVSS
jgi:hypothetical protein